MRLIHLIGCCLTLAIVLTPSDAGTWWGKGDKKPNTNAKPSDVQVGLVKGKKTSSAQQPSTQLSSQKAPGDSKTNAGTKPGSPAQITVDKEVMENPNSQAVVVAGATAVAVAQKQIDKNDKKTKKIEKKLENLNQDLKTINKDDSLSDITKDLLEITKRRVKLKAALLVYGIINFILYVAQYAGSAITPPVGRAIYFLDLLAKRVIRKPLDDYFADFQNAQAEVVAKYVDKHKDEYKDAKVGKQVMLRTPSGNYKFRILKNKPGEQLDVKDLTVADRGSIQVLRYAAQMKR